MGVKIVSNIRNKIIWASILIATIILSILVFACQATNNERDDKIEIIFSGNLEMAVLRNGVWEYLNLQK